MELVCVYKIVMCICTHICIYIIFFILCVYIHICFPCGPVGKESTCNAGMLGSSLGWEDPLEKGMATYSSILSWRILMDRGAWQATVHEDHRESDVNEQLSTHINTYIYTYMYIMGFLCSLDSKESACKVGDLGLIPGLAVSPGERNGNPFQYSYLENLMDEATVHRVTKSQTRLSD